MTILTIYMITDFQLFIDIYILLSYLYVRSDGLLAERLNIFCVTPIKSPCTPPHF